jgi:hypothetical protein
VKHRVAGINKRSKEAMMIAATTPLQTAGTVDMSAAHGKAMGQRLLKQLTEEQSAGKGDKGKDASSAASSTATTASMASALYSALNGDRSINNSGDEATAGGAGTVDQSQLREKFDSFVGESFYGQMLQAMHKTVAKPAYFSGGRAEEMFQGQLDQVLSEKMTKANGNSLSASMFDLFNLQTTGGRK